MNDDWTTERPNAKQWTEEADVEGRCNGDVMVVEMDVDLFNYAALYCCCCKESDASDDQLDMEDRMHSERMPGSYSFPNWPSIRCLLGCLNG